MGLLPGLKTRLRRDPRYAQLVVLGGLLVYGVFWLGFALSPWALLIVPGAACLLEALLFRFRRAADRPRPPYESALISSFSLLLLLRAPETTTYLILIVVLMLSKVLIRFRGRHFINPSNGAVLFGAAFLPAWISSGQWGYNVLFIFCLSSCAWLVLSRAGRLDSAFAFLGGLLAFGALRVLIFGYKWPVLAHQFEAGALWLFALYMITDPRTTPKLRATRVLHGALVALLAVVLVQFFYIRDSFLWALLALSPTVPLLDLASDAWTSREKPAQGDFHAPTVPARAT